MSTHFQRIEAVYKREDLTRPEKDLLIYMCHRTNAKTGTTDPSLSTIAKETGMSRRSILNARQGLRSAGLLSWVRRLLDSTHNDTTEYRVNLKTLYPKGHKGVVSERHQSTTTRPKQHKPKPAQAMQCAHCRQTTHHLNDAHLCRMCADLTPEQLGAVIHFPEAKVAR